MLIKNICKNIKILKKNINMIRGIHYFSTELKTEMMSSQGDALRDWFLNEGLRFHLPK